MLKALIRCGAMAVLAALALAGPAAAGIWTAIPSGTTASITAITYAGTTPVYGTASGQILKNGVVKSTNAGFGVRDIRFAPGGTLGLAALTNGRLLRSTDGGETWSAPLALNTYNQTSVCSTTPGGPVGTTAVTGNINAVSFKDASTAYAVVQQEGVIQKSTNGGVSWTEVGRLSNNTCRADPGSSYAFTDVFAVPGSDVVWLQSPYFGRVWLSTDGVTSPIAAPTRDGGLNCYDRPVRLAVDPAQTSVAFQVAGCNGGLALAATSDGGATWSSQNYPPNDYRNSLTGLNGVAVAGGSALVVGNGGAILVDANGRDAYAQRADGTDATNDWLSVAKLDSNNAVIGGAGGRLLTTTTAAAIPDFVAPAGTISGPTRVTAGQPATFTANLADNAGGSGIDPASIAWSASGIPNATGNPVALTFPSAGYYTLTVTFRDLAGNTGTATFGVTAGTPVVVPPPTTRTSTTRTTTATASGATIALGTPSTCVAPGSSFRVTLTWRKQKRKGNRFVKVRRADFYIGSRRVKIDSRAPYTQTLRVTASTRKGSSVTVKARAFIKVTRGRSPTKSIRTTIRVCG